jgi:hypothetical protein
MTMHIELDLRFFGFHKPSQIEWGTQTVTSFLFVFLVFVVVVFPLIRLEKYWNTFFLDIECIVCTILFGLLYAGRQFFLVDHDHSDTLEALAPAA